MIHEDSEKAVAHLVKYHSSHYPDGAEKTSVSLSTRLNEASSHAACNRTIAELIQLGGVQLRPSSQSQPTAMAYKAESARLSLELTLWKDFKFFQEHLRTNDLCFSLDKQKVKDQKWCEEDLVDTLTQYFDFKAYQVYHFWILETVMERANEAREILEEVIANGFLDNAEAKHYGKTAGEWMRLFDLYHVIADATRGTISEIEKVSLKLSSDLATRAGSELRFGDIRFVFMMFAARVAWDTDAFTGVPHAADKTSIGDSTFVGALGALDCQISYLMNWAVSWDLASKDLPPPFLLAYTSGQMQETMLDFLKARAGRFQAHSNVWQELVPHIEGKMLDLVSAGKAVPATLYEELERAKKAAMGNLSAAWEMEKRVRMTTVQFNEFNRGMKEPAQQWASVEAGSSQSGHFFPEARLFRPAMDIVATTARTAKMSTVAASTERPANKEGNAAQRQPTPDEDDLPDYEESEDEDTGASTERPANEDGNAAPRQATPDTDDLPDYEDFEDDEGALPPRKPEASTQRQSKSSSPPPPSDKAEHPGTAAQKPEEEDTRSPRYSPTPSPPPSPPPASPSRANDQPGSSATNARDSPPPPSPSNKRKRSASPPDEEEENDSRSPRQSPTPSPPPPKRARSSSPAHSPPLPSSKPPSPPPAPPCPSQTQAAADVGEPPAASSSNKRKRSASPPEEEEEEEAAEDSNRSPHHSPTPPPPPAKRARSTSPAPSPPPPKVDSDPEDENDDEPEGSNTKTTRHGRKPSAKSSKKGKGKATAGATKTGRVTKPKTKTPYKKKDYRAEAEANGGVRRSTRVRDMKKE